MHELAYKFLDTLDRSKATKRTYGYVLEMFYRTVGDVELEDAHYEKFLKSIRNLSPSTKRICSSAVSGFYSFYDIGSLSKRLKISKHYINKRRMQPVNFDREAVEKVLSHCEQLHGDLIDLRDRAFVLTLADSGFRISELSLLKRGDIDFLEGRVSIVGKGEKPASVRLSNRSISALKTYLSARAQMDGSTGRPLNSLPVFAQHGNINKVKPMTVSGMRKAIKLRMKEVGVNVRIHDFRHYFVTITLLASGDLELASKLARHGSIHVTERYAHYNETELDKKYDEIFNK